MNQIDLLQQIKQAVLEIEPAATIYLYGSRSRGDARPDSDWDLLVVVDGEAGVARTDTIRHQLLAVELESSEVISCMVRSRTQRDSLWYSRIPLSRNVRREGVIL